MHPRLGRRSLAPLAPLRPAWAQAFAWRPSGDGLLANAMRVSGSACGWGWAAAAPAAASSLQVPLTLKK